MAQRLVRRGVKYTAIICNSRNLEVFNSFHLRTISFVIHFIRNSFHLQFVSISRKLTQMLLLDVDEAVGVAAAAAAASSDVCI